MYYFLCTSKLLCLMFSVVFSLLIYLLLNSCTLVGQRKKKEERQQYTQWIVRHRNRDKEFQCLYSKWKNKRYLNLDIFTPIFKKENRHGSKIIIKLVITFISRIIEVRKYRKP